MCVDFFSGLGEVMINLTDALGVMPAMIKLRAERAEVIASNIANVDTPNYKAKDIQFSSVLSANGGQAATIDAQTMYRVPTQRTRDGNTVELQHEQANFAKNSMEYQQSLQFLKSKISGIQKAIDGK